MGASSSACARLARVGRTVSFQQSVERACARAGAAEGRQRHYLPVCQLARKSEEVCEEDNACLATDSDRFTPAEQAALTFAGLFAGDYMELDDKHYAALAPYFSVPQIT